MAGAKLHGAMKYYITFKPGKISWTWPQNRPKMLISWNFLHKIASAYPGKYPILLTAIFAAHQI